MNALTPPSLMNTIAIRVCEMVIKELETLLEQIQQGSLDEEARERLKGVESKAKGHGRNGASAYDGARKIKVVHDSLKRGDNCPHCLKARCICRRSQSHW